jgi:hypothetical protein
LAEGKAAPGAQSEINAFSVLSLCVYVVEGFVDSARSKIELEVFHQISAL